MICKTYRLAELFPALKNENFEPTLTAYCPDTSREIDPERRRASVLICPGGGYCFTSDREAEPVALHFVGQGYNAFVLRYSCAPAKYPQALLEASASVALIKRQAAEFHADPAKIAVCGFSAGGHLACSLGTLWAESFIAETLKLAPEENRPAGMILGYPVITSGEFAHRGSFDALLGQDAPAEKIVSLSLETRVTDKTPPAFIWHTANDDGVPVQNSLFLADALSRNNIPFELHIFPQGVHGLSLCDRRTGNGGVLDNPHCGQWTELCVNWLRFTFGA